MLTVRAPAITPLLRVLLVMAVLAMFFVWLAPPSEAKNCWQQSPETGQLEYVCGDEDDGDDGDDGDGDGDGDGDSDQQTCEFIGIHNEFCSGDDACYANVPAANDLEDLEPSDRPGPPPSEDAVLAYQSCVNPDGTPDTDKTYWYWAEPPTPSLPDRAELAYGRLSTPAFALEFGPDDMTYVGTETFFWVDGPAPGRIEGTPAFGLIAVGEPSHVLIGPGDGSGTMTCPWVLAKSADCVRTYQQTSADSAATDAAGTPSFRADATLVYDIHFEYVGNPGVPVDIPGLSADLQTLSSPTETTPVPVGEIQALVT